MKILFLYFGRAQLLNTTPIVVASELGCLSFTSSAGIIVYYSVYFVSTTSATCGARRCIFRQHDLGDVRRAALAAVADFQVREAVSVPAEEVDTSSASPLSSADHGGLSASSPPFADEVFNDEPAVALGSDMFDFELDMSGDMDLGSYYAEGMLLEPPPPQFTEVCRDAAADAVLWSQY